jgi:hypothetical protein
MQEIPAERRAKKTAKITKRPDTLKAKPANGLTRM